MIAVNGEEVEIDALDFHALHQLAAEVQCGCRSHDAAFGLGENGLIAFAVGKRMVVIDRLVNHVAQALQCGRNRSFAVAVEGLDEFLVWAVVQETECAAARCGVVDNLGHQTLVFAEIEFIADADLACRIDQHVPQTAFGVQLAQQEDLDAGSGLLLIAIQTRGKDLCVVENHKILLVEIVDEFLENFMFDFLALLVQHHHLTFVTMVRRLQCDTIFRKFELEL